MKPDSAAPQNGTEGDEKGFLCGNLSVPLVLKAGAVLRPSSAFVKLARDAFSAQKIEAGVIFVEPGKESW